MNLDDRQRVAREYTENLKAKIAEVGSFRPFDENFAPLDEESKRTMFKSRREAGWSVLKRAVFVMDKDSKVMTFYRHPMETSKMKKITSATPIDTYGLTSYNSIVIYGDADMSFPQIAQKRVQGWPSDVQLISIGMGHTVVASGYPYFFEVSYAVVPIGSKFTIGGVKAAFMDLENALAIMNSHGLEYKDMEISIARCLCKS